MVQVTSWARFPWLRHGFSRRSCGVSTVYAAGGDPELNLGMTVEDEAELVERNRRIATDRVGGAGAELATVRQVHGTRVLEVTHGGRAGDADGLISRSPGVVLGVLAADCVPILIADVRQRIVGALHAGWRGTAAGMAGTGISRLLELGARPEDLVAAVGPSIGPCCYVVGDEVRAAFAGRDGKLFQRASDNPEQSLDLWEANRLQLMEAGVLADRITIVGECTACSRDADGRRCYFSHRAEAGVTGRAMGMIGIALE